jgi:lipid-binding SYLF domain-containing protein
MRIGVSVCVPMVLLTGLAGAAPRAGRVSSDVTNRLTNAEQVFREIMDAPDKSIPHNLLDDAACIVIIPGMKKGAFIFGGQYGKGFISCRGKNGAGWTAPGAVTIEGGSFGLQLGGSETDAVLLLMNARAEDRLLSDQFTLGGDAEVAAGPVGRTAAAQTDAMLTAEILSYSRSRGVFAGVSLKGSTLRQDRDADTELYGSAVTNKQIVGGGVPAPAIVEPLVKELDKYSPRKSS